ncbi:MAG: hypothetical protein JXA09_17535 [Anaerolineae bacterium]|nr:hypothetical protein [Anaerolineae bacterium]
MNRSPGHDPAPPRIAPWVRPYILDLGCCGAAALRLAAPRYHLPGFDGDAWDIDLPQANVLVIAGRIPPRLVPVLRSWHGQVAPPGWTIAFGICAISGAVYGTVPARDVIPVDVEIAGCPPHVDALCDALATLPRRRAP